MKFRYLKPIALTFSCRSGANSNDSAEAVRNPALSAPNANKKFPVRWLRYPTASGPRYPPRLPSALMSPMAEPATDRGSVSVGMAQKGPSTPYDPAPTRAIRPYDEAGALLLARTLDSRRTPPQARAKATCAGRSRVLSECLEMRTM